MSFLHRRVALSRAALAAVVGLIAVLLDGPELAIPAVALVALVYWGHHLLAVLAGDDEVPYADLAFVIVVNATIVLLVQVLLFVAHLEQL
ncbi:MAG TPA: hypothetical protein VNP90_07465 [Actinomycetota bacterium]|nr:hypothetical protein [Actinomycetota bacterium]